MMDYDSIFILLTPPNWTSYGYLGLFAGCFFSALFIPLGADVLYVLLLSKGFNPWTCLTIASIAGWLGGLVIYEIGHAGNTNRIKKFFHIKEEQLVKQKKWIVKYGSFLALFVWVPVLGDISNVALGFYHTNRTRTFIYMFIGRMFRFLFWTILYLIYANRLIKFIDKIYSSKNNSGF